MTPKLVEDLLSAQHTNKYASCQTVDSFTSWNTQAVLVLSIDIFKAARLGSLAFCPPPALQSL